MFVDVCMINMSGWSGGAEGGVWSLLLLQDIAIHPTWFSSGVRSIDYFLAINTSCKVAIVSTAMGTSGSSRPTH